MLIGLGAAGSLQAQTSLIYATPRGVTYTVTEKGLSTVRKGFGAVIDGELRVINGESRFNGAGDGSLDIPTPSEMTLTVVSPKQARVRHVSGDVVSTYDYLFNDEDLLITCRIENNHPSATIHVPGLTGLAVHFARAPDGLAPVEEPKVIQELGLQAFHPSRFCPIGGSYAVDKEVGIGIAPANQIPLRTLLLWDYADWNAPERDRILERRLTYFVHTPIAPGGASTVGMTIRVSPEMSWQHLMEPYRTSFQKLYGDVKYQADSRWVAIENLNVKLPAAATPAKEKTEEAPKNPSPRTTVNPKAPAAPPRPPVASGGKKPTGPPKRPDSEEDIKPVGKGIDHPSGAQGLCDLVIPRLKEANGQGAILWGHGTVQGIDNFGLCEFNILHPNVEKNWKRVNDQFSKARLKLGVATNPNKISLRESWTERDFISINPHDAAHRQLVWSRYEQMINRGCGMFYLDEFGNSLEDVILMRFLREKMGPNIQTFASVPSDAMLVYSGGHSNAVLKTTSSAGLERGYRMQLGEKNWEVLRWLVPGCQLAGQLTDVQGNLNDALETPERFMFSRGALPFVATSDFNRVSGLNQIQQQFVNDQGAWVPARPKE